MAVRTSLNLESASVRNCSLFLASASADSSENVPASSSALLARPVAAASASDAATQFELRHGDGAGRLGRCGRLRDRLELRRQCLRLLARVGQAPFGETGGAGGAGQARHVPGNADGKAGCEPDDHSEDHGANVTMGCVDNGDRPPAVPAGAPAPAHGRAVVGPRTEPVA